MTGMRALKLGSTILCLLLAWPSRTWAIAEDLNVTRYGVKCVAGTDDSAALSNAATLAQAVGVGLVIPCAVQVSSPVPAIAAPVRFLGGGAINLIGSGRVTFTGPFDAPLKPIFLRNGGRWWFTPDAATKATELTLTDLTLAKTPQVYPEWWGADPTGAALSNDAFDAAKAMRRTVNLSAGIYRIEGYAAENLRLIGVRATGAYDNAQTVIEGAGDVFVNANNFSMEHLTIRNRRNTPHGKLVWIAPMDTGLGPFIDVEFGPAEYHLYQDAPANAVVGLSIRDCRFTSADVASRQFAGGLNRYSETSCYTTSNGTGLVLSSTSSALVADSVFEYQRREAIRVAITNPTATFFGFKLSNVHFETNGCPSRDASGACSAAPADLSPDIRLSSALAPRFGPALISMENLSFNVPVLPNATVALSGDGLAITQVNCHGLAYAGRTPGMQIHQSSGGGAMSATVTDSDTKLLPMPSSFEGMLVLVRDATTEGGAVLLLTTSTVNVVASSLTAVVFTIGPDGYLYARTTGGSSWRILYWTRLRT